MSLFFHRANPCFKSGESRYFSSKTIIKSGVYISALRSFAPTPSLQMQKWPAAGGCLESWNQGGFIHHFNLNIDIKHSLSYASTLQLYFIHFVLLKGQPWEKTLLVQQAFIDIQTLVKQHKCLKSLLLSLDWLYVTNSGRHICMLSHSFELAKQVAGHSYSCTVKNKPKASHFPDSSRSHTHKYMCFYIYFYSDHVLILCIAPNNIF